MLRAKGFFWLASRGELAGEWSQAGKVLSVGPAGIWASPAARGQELVFIGDGLDQAAIEGDLEACLLSDAEKEVGESAWTLLADPFPRWEA